MSIIRCRNRYQPTGIGKRCAFCVVWFVLFGTEEKAERNQGTVTHAILGEGAWYDCHVAVKAGFIVEMQFWGVTRKLLLGILHGTQLPGIL